MKTWKTVLALLVLAVTILLSSCGATVDVNVHNDNSEPTTSTTAQPETTTAPSTTTTPTTTTTTVPTTTTTTTERPTTTTTEWTTTVATDPPTTAAPAYYGDFSIEGKWKNTGDTTYCQAGRGAIIVFNGVNCNFISPSDTYAFYKNGNAYQLDCTTYLFSDTLSFTVTVSDQEHMQIHTGAGTVVEFTRVG